MSVVPSGYLESYPHGALHLIMHNNYFFNQNKSQVKSTVTVCCYTVGVM